MSCRSSVGGNGSFDYIVPSNLPPLGCSLDFRFPGGYFATVEVPPGCAPGTVLKVPLTSGVLRAVAKAERRASQMAPTSSTQSSFLIAGEQPAKFPSGLSVDTRSASVGSNASDTEEATPKFAGDFKTQFHQQEELNLDEKNTGTTKAVASEGIADQVASFGALDLSLPQFLSSEASNTIHQVSDESEDIRKTSTSWNIMKSAASSFGSMM